MEKKVFYESNNLKICGLLNINDTNNKTMIVICHARASQKNATVPFNVAQELNKYKINNFRFDGVSCGESEGDYKNYTVSNLVTNLNATLAMLQNNYGFSNFILIGHSLGGRIISLVDRKKFNILKLIFIAPALDYQVNYLVGKKEKIAKKQGYYLGEKNTKFSYEYFVDERKHKVFKILKKWDIPKLFIHGKKDPFVNYECSIKINKKCKNSNLVLIDNGDHSFHDEISMQELLQFVISYIKS